MQVHAKQKMGLLQTTQNHGVGGVAMATTVLLFAKTDILMHMLPTQHMVCSVTMHFGRISGADVVPTVCACFTRRPRNTSRQGAKHGEL